MKSKKRTWFFLSLILIFYFILAYTAIFKQDDFRWATDLGMNRLTAHFENYNGRYFGNYIILALTRSQIVQAVLPTIVNTGIVYFIYKIFNKEVNLSVIMFFILTLPFSVYRQTYGWLSGFANYNMAIFLILVLAYFILKETMTTSDYIFLMIVAFSVQLFLENTSAVNIVISLLFLIYSVTKRKNLKKAIALFIPNLIGTMVMFSNAAYLPDAGSRSLSHLNFKILPFSFFGKWSEMFFKENFLLLFLLAFGLYLISKEKMNYLKYMVFPIPMYFLLRSKLSVNWENLPNKILYFEGFLVIFFIVLSFYLVFKSDVLTNSMKNRFALFFTLAGLYSGPFLILQHPVPDQIISYINYRNILGTYILLIIAILYLYLPFFKSEYSTIKKVRQILPLLTISIMMIISSMATIDYIFDHIRIAQARDKIENGRTEVSIERLPFELLHFPWYISETNDFESDFNKYYNFPENVSFNEVPLRNKYSD